MKAFIISLSIIILIFALTIVNSIYVGNATDFLIKEAKKLNASDGSVDTFLTLWESKQIIIRLSSSHEETHKIDEALAILKAKAQAKEENGFSEYKALLVEYLEQIHEDETITFDNII